MTIQPAELTDVFTYTDEDVHVPLNCEHSGHKKISITHDTGPATHYIRTIECEHCGDPSMIYAACQLFTTWVQTRPDATVKCTRCHHVGAIWENLTVVGPIGGKT